MKRHLVVIASLLLLMTACRTAPVTAPEVAEPAPVPSAPAAVPESPVAAPEPPPPAALGIAAVEIRNAAGQWEPVVSGSTFPVVPLTLRLRYEGSMPPEEVTLDPPPPMVEYTLSNYHSVRLYFGEAPSLAAVDPVSGSEQTLRPAPADVVAAALSQDGQWLAFLAPADPLEWLVPVRLLRLSTGEVQETGFRSRGLGEDLLVWHANRLVATFQEKLLVWDPATGKGTVKESAARNWLVASPDGRYTAGYAFAGLENTSAVIFDAQTGAEKVVPGLKSKVHACWIDLAMAWAPNGKALLVEEHPQAGGGRVLRIDPVTGELRPVTEKLPPATAFGKWGEVTVQGQGLGEGLAVGWRPDGTLLVIRWPNYKHRIQIINMC